mgnify:CR=1 FL=1
MTIISNIGAVNTFVFVSFWFLLDTEHDITIAARSTMSRDTDVRTVFAFAAFDYFFMQIIFEV